MAAPDITEWLKRIFEPVVRVDTKLSQIYETLLESRRKKGKEIVLTYPHAGGTKSFSTGTTIVDFYNGTVIFPDGTRESLFKSLKEHGQTHISAIYVSSNAEVKVNFDNGGEYTFSDYIMEVTDFQIAYITTTKSTSIAIKAWTSEKGYLTTPKPGTAVATRILMRTEASQALSAGALSKTTSSASKRWKLIEVLLHASVNISETVTIYFDSITGSDYDTIIYSVVLSARANVQFHPESEVIGNVGDEITVTCTNANATGTVYLTILLEEI